MFRFEHGSNLRLAKQLHRQEYLRLPAAGFFADLESTMRYGVNDAF